MQLLILKSSGNEGTDKANHTANLFSRIACPLPRGQSAKEGLNVFRRGKVHQMTLI